MAVFDSKNWNSEVFGKYLETVPRVKQNAFLKAGILRGRPELKSMLTDQTGGNFITVPMTGLLGGDVLNYDGSTNITADGLETFLQSMIVVGRAKAWKEKDFTYDITGKNFMEEIGKQVANYWDDIDQETILAELEGIFKCGDDGFATKHTHDITGLDTKTVGATTLNDAVQKAAGANKNIFTMAIMHSVVATTLENLQILEYRKQTDAEGIQRTVALADWNGRTVMIDDDVPTSNVETTAGVYGATISTAASAGDKIEINGVEFTWIANGETPAAGEIALPSTNNPTNEAGALVTALNASEDERLSHYTWSNTTGTLKATEDSGHYGEGPITVLATKGSGGTMVVGAVETITAPVLSTNYTTYLLGQGAFDYCDCGAKVPNETWRDPKVNGGEDMLITRQRKLFAPRGFSFSMPTPAIVSPTNTQLKANGAWRVVKDTAGTGYFNSKAIPFARIISRG